MQLISNNTVQKNLRRTANEGFISILDNNLMHDLAYKYFGVYENGKIIGYQCPYSGKIYSNPQDIILEHIIPIKSGGGTVLFNCIPASLEVNSPKEKGAKHLIEWWISSKYWDIDAPKRLEKLVNYILDGYENVFNTFSLDELEDTYLDYIDEDSYSYDEDLDLKKDDLISERQARQNHINSYQGFLNDCIEQLRKSKIDVSYIEDRLNTIQNKKHIFEDIERFKQFQNIIKKLIIEYIGDDNRTYLTHSLNINIKKLMDSINYESPEQIYFELKQRLNNIMDICKQNGVSFNDYLKNLRDIEEINILYLSQNQIEEHIKKIFINNIKIGLDTKIDVFINMLSIDIYTQYKNGKPTTYNIFSVNNKIPFEGYERIEGLNTKLFWQTNRIQIEQRLKELKESAKTEEEKLKYKEAEKAIDNYKFYSQVEKRIDVFIDMLSNDIYSKYYIKSKGKVIPDSNNIFAHLNKIPFEGYESLNGIDTSLFWSYNKKEIEQRLKELKESAKTEEEKLKYEKVEKAIDNYKFYLEKERKIDVFIDMLCSKKYTNYYISATGHYSPDINNIFSSNNQIPFEGYESIEGLNTKYFWQDNKKEIEQRLKELKESAKTEEEKIKFEQVQKNINKFNFYSQVEKRIEVFIEMLSKDIYTQYKNGKPDEKNIFGYYNEILFEGYESLNGINTSHFWGNQYSKIIEKLFYGEYRNKIEYNKAREAVLTYLKVNTIEEYIDKLDKSKTKNKVLVELRNSQLKEIEKLTRENQLLSSELYVEEQKGKVV